MIIEHDDRVSYDDDRASSSYVRTRFDLNDSSHLQPCPGSHKVRLGRKRLRRGHCFHREVETLKRGHTWPEEELGAEEQEQDYQ